MNTDNTDPLPTMAVPHHRSGIDATGEVTDTNRYNNPPRGFVDGWDHTVPDSGRQSLNYQRRNELTATDKLNDTNDHQALQFPSS